MRKGEQAQRVFFLRGRCVRPEDIKRLYDAGYAATYETKFLTAENLAPDTAFELELLQSLLRPRVEWLDVACGTGFFMRHFEDVRRTGIDLSPAMLELARRSIPEATFFEQDFRQPRPEWSDRFDLVSCMWYAYSLVDTIDDVNQLIDNLACWTSRSGTCFVPLADPRMISRSNLPYEVPDGPPGVFITGILWSFIEDDGQKVHAHLVTPQIEFMIEQFERFFKSVRIVRYPHKADGVTGRAALIATDKR
jgi:SAM-dependent methyltransferase